MFKKGIKINLSNPLKGSAVRKLKAEVEATMEGLTADDIKELFPSKCKWIANKCTGKILIYTEAKSNEPLFFHLHGGKGALVPTVYLVWRFPKAIPIWRTPANVWRNLKSGADLMLAGVHPPRGEADLGEFKEGVVRAVAIMGNPHAVGVGITACSSKDIQAKGMTGKGLLMMNIYADHLYAIGSKTKPNEGFLKSKVVPIEEEMDQKEDAGEEKEAKEEEEGKEGKSEAKEEGEEEEKEEKEKKAPVKLTEEEIDEMKANMDEAIVDLFFRAIVLVETLPISAADLYSEHMLPRLRKGERVDFKKSSYKKLANFIKQMERDEVIAVKQRKDGAIIQGINRGHETIEEYETRAAHDKLKGKDKKTGKKPRRKRQPGRELEVKMLYQPGQRLLEQIFRPLGLKEKLLSLSDARKLLWQYVRANDLETQDRKSIKIDPKIRLALFKKGDKYANANTITKKDLAMKLTQAMNIYHLILFDDDDERTDLSRFSRGDAPPVVISQGARQGNKVVTMVEGIEAWEIDGKELATMIRKKHACSTTTQTIVRKKREIKMIVAQGNLMSEIQGYLTQNYGVPGKYVAVNTKPTKAPKKSGGGGPRRGNRAKIAAAMPT